MKSYLQKKNKPEIRLCVFAASLIVCLSCVSKAPSQMTVIRPEKPQSPRNILGKGLTSRETLGAFLLDFNQSANKTDVYNLAGIYIEESAIEGVNHDVAFSQMCLETGFLRFGGLVTPDMNNFCGLGSTGPGQKGLYFPSAEIGVRAHIQHLKGYASTAPLQRPLVDPRYRYVKYGIAPDIYELAGRWATDKEYGNKIATILDRLYDFAFPN